MVPARDIYTKSKKSRKTHITTPENLPPVDYGDIAHYFIYSTSYLTAAWFSKVRVAGFKLRVGSVVHLKCEFGFYELRVGFYELVKKSKIATRENKLATRKNQLAICIFNIKSASCKSKVRVEHRKCDLVFASCYFKFF